MNFYGNSLRNDLISLEELALLESEGRRNHLFSGFLISVCKEFPSGDVRIVYSGDPHSNYHIANSDALGYWVKKYPKHPAPTRIAEPVTIGDWQKLVAGLKADNDRLRGLADVASGESLPANATDDMRTCIEVSQRYWSATREGDDNNNFNLVDDIVEWIETSKKISGARAQAIQKVTRPMWAKGTGRPKTE